MNDPHRAEKLALARRKLKEFESKRRTDGSPTPHADGRCSSLSNGSVQSMDRIEAEREPFQVVNANGSDNLHIDRQTNASSVSSINSSVVMTNGGQMETGQILPHPYTSAIETRLVQERDVAVQAYEQIKQQLSDLHGHYAHLHAAYSHLSSNRAHSELESQIIQLQSAVSVLVEEKTTLQAELRVAREQCEQIATSHIKVQADAVQFQTEQELRNLRHKLEQALALTGAQATELEQQRRISAETQARTISVQNEKSEAQLRVKALIRDRDALNEELAAVRKDLQMKNLHLKQLTKHQSQTPDETAAASDQIHTMTERLETITAELLATRTERDVVIKDSETSRRQFERYTAELSERNGSLRQELEAAETQRSFFESRAQELEMQLTHLQQSSGPSEAQNAPPADSSQAEEYLKKIRHLEEKLSETTSKLLAEKKDAGEQIERYSSVVAMKNEEVLNMSIKLRQLEERIQETRASESELLLLSEQLQSEKATVSRAVAQNKELKEQLLETEDRIFVLTNEKMQMEMDKEAAEHQVRVLSEQLGGSHNLSSSHQDESADHLEANEAEALAMRTEKEHELQQKLAQALHELADTRQELRQSHSRNEQMNQIMMNNAEDENQNSIHVELGHAMTRVNQLAAENEQLRESLAELHRRESELTEQLAFLPKIETVLEAKESPARERKESEVLEDVVDETHPVLCSPQNFTGPKLEQWARVELEKKFTESMRRNAELADNLDKIEHINEQLQMENETIGDHVILYHQQRKIIQDRLRLKDQQLLAMEAEKQRVVERCRELQQAMREVLAARDLPNTSPLNRSVYRSYSHSTIDEINGDEEQLVSEEDANSQVDCSTSQKDDGEVVYREEGRTSPQLEGTEAKVQRIFNILDEISTTPVKSADDMHCSHCIGELKKL